MSTYDLPDGKIRILLAPCGCMAGADASTSVPGFCRSVEEAEKDLAAGFHEVAVDQADYKQRPMGCDHTPEWGAR